MKKIILLFVAIAMFSCKEKNNDQPEALTLKYKKPEEKAAAVTFTSCIYGSTTTPTTYTGYSDTQIAGLNGFGMYSNTSYDVGYRQGYEDALFYHQYFEYSGAEDCVSYGISRAVRNENTNQISYHPLEYTPTSGEHTEGVQMTIIRSGNCPSQTVMKRCVLLNATEPKQLRLQYLYNTTSTVTRSASQVSFDAGRYDGFYNGVYYEPLSLQPEL